MMEFNSAFDFDDVEVIAGQEYPFELMMSINKGENISRKFVVTPYYADKDSKSLLHNVSFEDWSRKRTWYKLDSHKNLGTPRSLKIPGFSHYNARFASSWNRDGLSLAIEVYDRDFIPPVNISTMFTHDSIQVYFDQVENKSLSYDGNDLIFQLGLLNGKPNVWREYAPFGSHIGVADVKPSINRINGKFTRYEAFFLSKEFTHTKLENGQSIGFSLQVNNRDLGRPNNDVISALPMNTENNSWNKPYSWRDLLLIDKRS